MLNIPKELADRMNAQAAQTYPEECCGVLIGTDDGESRTLGFLYETQNIHSENRARRFLIGPDDYKKAEKKAREVNADIIGFYHSHPDHPAIPSEHDREFAWPWYLYVIVSVSEGTPDSFQAWKLYEDRSGFENIHITIS